MPRKEPLPKRLNVGLTVKQKPTRDLSSMRSASELGSHSSAGKTCRLQLLSRLVRLIHGSPLESRLLPSIVGSHFCDECAASPIVDGDGSIWTSPGDWSHCRERVPVESSFPAPKS